MVPKPLRTSRQPDLPSDEVPKEVEEWSTQDVYNWMRSNGFSDYADNFSKVHKIDGQTLLMLSEKDLKEPPLQIACLGDIKRISKALYNLQKKFYGRYPESHVYESNEDPAAVCLEYNRRRKFSISGESVILNTRESAVLVDEDSEQFPADIQTVKLISRDELIRHIESPDTKLKSYTKLGISFGYCLASLLITSFVMVLVHDRVPDMKTYPPLPDIVLDNLPLIPWAFEMCEIIGVVLSTICFCIILFHKHRVIILRRMFSLVGTVFLLRCVTMMITSLSVPGGHLECRAKSYGSLKEKIVQAFHIWSKLGMSIQGVRSCGDYMFSGHTTAITMLNHFITEYTPYSWSGLHTCTWCLNLFGIFFILAGHEHYSIDVFIAFYISSRMFLYYHAYAYNHANLTATDDRMRLWFPLIWFFEGGSIGKVNNEFEMPFLIWMPRRPSFFSQGNAMKANSKSSTQDLKKDTSTKNVTAHKKKKN